MELSKYCFTFIVEGAIALYHSLNINVVFLPFEIIPDFSIEEQTRNPKHLINLLDQESITCLTKEGFIVADKDIDRQKLRTIRKNETGRVDIQLMYLLLADQCNLSCRYCFFETEMPVTNEPRMSITTAEKAINAFCHWQTPERAASIQLYGGDPLTNRKTLLFAVEYIAKLIEQGRMHKNSTITIVCNGTLVDMKFVTFLKQYQSLINISVSLDGPKEIHDKWRVNCAGKGSYEHALRGYKLLQANGLNPSISCTLPPTNLQYFDKIIAWLISQQPNGLSFNTMTDIPGMVMDTTYAEKVADFMINAFLRLRIEGIYEDRMMRKVKSFTNEQRFLKDCCGYGQQIVIAPNGDIGVCHGFTASRDFFVANVNNVDDFNPTRNTTFIEWSRRSPVNINACQKCSALGICGGGCAYNAHRRHGSIWEVDDIFCPQAKKILEWMINDVFKQIEK